MKTSEIDQSLRISINEISDQLCKSVDGIFNFKLTTPSSDIDIQKMVMLINFLLDQYDRSTIRLEESERQFRGLVTNLPGVIYRCLLDENWTMLYISDGVETITGYSADEFIQNKTRTYASVIHPGDQDKVDRVVNEAIQKNEPYEVEYRVNHKDGEVRWVYEKGQAIIDELSNVQYLDGAIFDITDVKESRLKLQEAQEREAIQKGKLEMSSSVLHDIGNAVTNLGTVSNRLLSDIEWSETDELNNLHDLFESEKESVSDAMGEERCEALLEFMNELRQSIQKRSESYHSDFQRILKTVSHINDILHIQRRYAKSGTLIQRDQLNLLDIISDSLSVMSGSVEKRGIELKYQLPDTIPKVQGDRTHLMQVFSNLFKNSCESFDLQNDNNDSVDKLIVISLTTYENSLILEIKDNAKGFDPALAEKLFEQGFSTKNRDSGIGLYQSRKTIESHGGTLNLTSEGEGTGAAAVIQLPIQIGETRE